MIHQLSFSGMRKINPYDIELMNTIYHVLQPHYVCVDREGQSSGGEGWKSDLL